MVSKITEGFRGPTALLCHSFSQHDSSEKFGDDGEEANLDHGQGSSGDGSGVGIGDIVGTVTKSGEEVGDEGDGEDPEE